MVLDLWLDMLENAQQAEAKLDSAIDKESRCDENWSSYRNTK
jgi:hypothetical protein